MPMPTGAPVAMPIPASASPAITAEMVAQVGAPEAQKQFLGEHLYPKVMNYDKEKAGRIVGMMIDAYSTEQLIENLANEASLKTSVDRAVMTISQHETTDQP